MLAIASILPFFILLWLLGSASFGLGDASPGVFAVAVFIYILSHLLRSLRLFLLLYDGRIKLEHTLCYHFYSSTVSAMLPFKLGEIWRILVIGRYVTEPCGNCNADLSSMREWARVVMVIWIERLFDFAAIFVALAIIALLQSEEGSFIWLGGIAIVLFMALSLLLAMPYNIHLLQRYVITRYNGTGVLSALRFCDEMREIISDAGRRIKVRGGAVLVITGLIWILEMTAILMIIGFATVNHQLFTSLVFGLGFEPDAIDLLKNVLLLGLSAGSVVLLCAKIVSFVLHRRQEKMIR